MSFGSTAPAEAGAVCAKAGVIAPTTNANPQVSKKFKIFVFLVFPLHIQWHYSQTTATVIPAQAGMTRLVYFFTAFFLATGFTATFFTAGSSRNIFTALPK